MTVSKHVIEMNAVNKDTGPFDMLSNEVALIPIRMAMNNMNQVRRHDFLFDVIAMVSTRFKALAKVKSLWKGEVWIEGNGKKIKKVIHEFLSDDVTHLHLRGHSMTTISEEKITTVAAKCSELLTLSFSHNLRLNSWPTFDTPWTSLTKLRFGDNVRIHNIFQNVELHHSLPNLKIFEMKGTFSFPYMHPNILPDLSGCKQLEKVRLGKGDYVVNGLPSSLKNFDGTDERKGMSTWILYRKRVHFERRFEDCRVDPYVRFEGVPLFYDILAILFMISIFFLVIHFGIFLLENRKCFYSFLDHLFWIIFSIGE